MWEYPFFIHFVWVPDVIRYVYCSGYFILKSDHFSCSGNTIQNGLCPFSAGDCKSEPIRSYGGLIPGIMGIFCRNHCMFFGYCVILYSRSRSYKY